MTSQYRKSPTVYAPPTLYARLFRHVGHAHASSARTCDSLAWPLVQENLVADVERPSYLTGSNEEQTCLVLDSVELAAIAWMGCAGLACSVAVNANGSPSNSPGASHTS